MRFAYFLIATVLTKMLVAQNFCYTSEMQDKWFATHPDLKEKFEILQNQAARADSELYKTNYKTFGNQNKTFAASNYTIPIVFHILHLGGTENISDAQVEDAVDILNRDFNKLNADTTDVVSPFQAIMGNAKFEFRLATKDPNGNCTNGIIRHYDFHSNWTGNFGEYAYTWNPSRYLNVYVVKSISNGSAAYTYLPGSGVPTSADVIVILNTYLGSVGTGNIVNSRALTHEIGHWFSLIHVWGLSNQPGLTCGDDGVADTPITKGFGGCNLNNASVCNAGIVENMQNYMDYAYCSRMFTIGQAARMNLSINNVINGRNNLSTAVNLSLTGVSYPGNYCLPMVNISVGQSTKACRGAVISVSSYSYNANPNTYLWFVSGNATILNPTSPNTGIIFANSGTYTLSCLVANANGSTTQSLVMTIIDSGTKISSLNRESFENTNFQLPAGWTVINSTTPDEKWEVSDWTASNGLYSMLIAGENMSPNSVEILESPSYDFKSNLGAHFTFKYAYAKHGVNSADVFKVQVSMDCGGSWNDLFVPNMNDLASASGGTDLNLFVPKSSQWVLKDLTDMDSELISRFQNENNVRFRFYFKEDINGYGNRFYLDEVNFNEPVGINEFTKSIDFNLFPNPTKSDFIIKFILSDEARIKYSVASISGLLVIKDELRSFVPGIHQISFNQNKLLKPGIYFLNFEVNGFKIIKKIVVSE